MNKEILEITKKFHDTYEKLASEYTYETREDTKVFDINSNNGKLMYATVNEIVSPILEENQELKKQLEEYKEQVNKGLYNTCLPYTTGYNKAIKDKEIQQKEFIEWLEDKIQQQETLMAENQEKLYFLMYEDEKENLKLSSQKAYIRRIILEEILQKYKEIIGDDK